MFEDGPSVDLTLQWATYRDAADQCSLSRIWGGIHPPADDIPGRLIGGAGGHRRLPPRRTLFLWPGRVRGQGAVQRGYLLNLRVKVPSAQIPVWRRSHIRQATGVTLTAESPDVNVLKRGREAPDQPRRLAIRRAVARANGLIVETPPPSVELVAGYSECQGFPSPTRWPVLVRKRLGSARSRLPAEVEGGNSEQFSRESPEGVLLRQDDPGMPKTGPITVGWREVERRAADWRMRPASEDGRDNITRLERGPQGSGGDSGSAPPGH